MTKSYIIVHVMAGDAPSSPRGAAGEQAGTHPQAGDGGGEQTMGDSARAGASKINAFVLKYGDAA